jgi:hypothetical protein
MIMSWRNFFLLTDKQSNLIRLCKIITILITFSNYINSFDMYLIQIFNFIYNIIIKNSFHNKDP